MSCAVLVALASLMVEPTLASLPFNRTDCKDAAADQHYFPALALDVPDANFDGDRFRRNWYSKPLRAMAEPSLSCQPPAGESYRFLWLRTWGRPISVRIEHTPNATKLHAAELDGAGGYDPGKVARRVQRNLTGAEWKQVTSGLAAADFWNMPAETEGGLDGAQWILEGRRGSRYHVVDRWSPKGGAYYALCTALVRMAGLWPTGRERRDSVY